MTQYVINIGAVANDGTGDPLRTAFNEVNLNFDQVFAAGPVLSNVQIANNTILTTNTNGNLVLAPNGTGVLQSNVNIVPNTSNIRNLGAADRRWSTLYIQYANVSGAITVADFTATGNVTVGGNLSVMGNVINVGNIITDAKTIQLANTAGTANAASGSGITVGANDAIATMLYSSATNAWTFNIGVDTPNIVVNNISSDDSTFVTIQDGLDVQGDITAETLSLTGTVTAGNILPRANTTYSLGNSTLYWSNLWVANNTIYIGGVPLGMAAGNVLTVDGNAVLTNGSNTTISTTGNITTGNILTNGVVSATGNVTGNYFIGNGSQLTGLASPYTDANVTTLLSNLGSNIISSTGNVTTTANISGQYILGNGSQLIGITSSYGDANVATLLSAFGSNAISTTGNITTGNLVTANAGNIVLGNSASKIKQSGSNATVDLAGSITLAPDNSASPLNGVIIGGLGYLLAPDSSRNATLNYGGSSGTMGIYTVNIYGNTVTAVTNGGANGVGNIGANASNRFNTAFLLAVDAAGNVTGGNITTAGLVTATGNVTGGNLIAVGNVGAAYVNVTQDLQANYVSASANISGGNVIITGTFYGTGVSAVGNTISGNVTTTGVVTATGNIIGGNILTAGLFSATGNVTANYFIGNGSQLTGLPAGYANSDVATFLAAFGSNSISTTGNVTANNISGNILVTGNVTGTTPNVTLIAGSYSWTFDNTGNTAFANGTITAGNISATGAVFGERLISTLSVGNEGGQVNLSLPAANTTLTTSITLDSFRDRFRVFETGGTNRGMFIDLDTSPAGGAAIGYRDIPQVSFTGNATLAASDAGKHYYSTQSTDYVLTIANNTSVGWSVGTAITIVNRGTGNMTIAQGTGVSLYLAGNSTSGNRTVTTYGMATLLNVAANVWMINGTGVS